VTPGGLADIARSRRWFLRMSAGFLAGTVLADIFTAGRAVATGLAIDTRGVAGKIEGPMPRALRSLSFENTHTGEILQAIYWSDGAYRPDALSGINRILRDHRSGEVKEIDTKLLDLLHSIRERLGSCEPFHVISGYRSPATNAMLRRKGRRVAAGSLHTAGRAIDVRLPGTLLGDLRAAARAIGAGGVGFYPSSDFVHVDTGRVREW
jgi:uncharacterized protein YcbK (DUF882 family)